MAESPTVVTRTGNSCIGIRYGRRAAGWLKESSDLTHKCIFLITWTASRLGNRQHLAALYIASTTLIYRRHEPKEDANISEYGQQVEFGRCDAF